MTTDAVKLAPSILAADFAHLGDQVAEAKRAGADRIYVDVMDGHFVPNLSMGPPDHLDDALAGTDLFIIHWEGNNDLRTVQRIKSWKTRRRRH